MGAVCEDFGAALRESNGETGHVHLRYGGAPRRPLKECGSSALERGGVSR